MSYPEELREKIAIAIYAQRMGLKNWLSDRDHAEHTASVSVSDAEHLVRALMRPFVAKVPS